MRRKWLTMMQSHLDARLWEMKCWKKANLSQCLRDACQQLKDKKIALFGSYGWGDGEWMRNWEDECRNAGAVLACDSVTCNDAPDSDCESACRTLGKRLA